MTSDRRSATSGPTPSCWPRTSQGDPDAFGVLFGRHRDRLWAVALRTMGNPEDAADGLQDGLVAAYRRAGSLPRRGRGDHLAAPGRGQRLPGPDPGREGTPRRARCPTTWRSTPAAAPSRPPPTPPRTRPTVRSPRSAGGRCSTRSPPCPAEQRAALVLVDMEGYPVAEAARDARVRGRHREVAVLARPGPARACCSASSPPR